MFDKKQILKLLSGMDLSSYAKPSEEYIEEILSHGKTRMLSNLDTKLDSESVNFFTFCWTQVGRFGFSNLNAIEIGYIAHLPPIYVACAIHRHGMEWAVKLLHMKRVTMVDRGMFSIVKAGSNFFSVFDLDRQLLSAPTNKLGSELRSLIRSRKIADLRLRCEDNGGNICRWFVEPPHFSVPSTSKSIPEKREKKKIDKGSYKPRHNGVDADI